MKIQLLQTDIRWRSPRENRDRIMEKIDAAPHADLVVLPEMFTTGYCMKGCDAVETGGTGTLEWMMAAARERDCAITGSVAVEEGGNYFNRMFFVRPDGSYDAYDKRHLFSFAGEDREYTAGDKRVIAEYKGVRILLQVCYDLRFPVFARNTGDYDMIVYVANWPVPRVEVWNTLLRARAIENVCYVAGVNRVGSDPNCEYNGGTAFVNYRGEVVARAGDDREEMLTVEADMKALAGFRAKFPALGDADKFTII